MNRETGIFGGRAVFRSMLRFLPGFCILFVSPSLYPSENAIRFECQRLYEHIAEELEILPGLPIFPVDMLDLTELHARSADIWSLSGLQHAIHLRVLDLRDNRIQDIQPLIHLDKLEWLSLRENQKLRDVSALAGLVQLRYLNLNRNEKIQSLQPIRNLHRLHTLIVRDVPVMHISVEQSLLKVLPGLKRLNLRNTGFDNAAILIPGLEQGLYTEQLDLRDNSIDSAGILRAWDHVKID